MSSMCKYTPRARIGDPFDEDSKTGVGHQSLTPLLDLRNNGTPTHDETYVVPPPSLDGLAEWRGRLN